MYGVLILAEFSKMTKTQSSIGKHPLLNLTNNLFVLWSPGCFPIIILHVFSKFDASVIQRGKDILSKIKCNEKVAGSLTFWLKDQYLASFSRLSFENEVRSLIIAKIQTYWTGKNAPFLSQSDLDLKNWHVSVWKYSFYDNVPIPICCTTRQTELRNNRNMS